MRKILYLDIVNDIKGQIERGELKPDDILPSEHELSEHYDVSRTTLRKSLALLVNGNYIYTIPGKGNFVCEPTFNYYQFYFDELGSLKGQVDNIKLVSVKAVKPGRHLMRELKVSSSDKVLKVEKIINIEDKVAEYSIVYLPYQKGNPIIEDVINFANFHDLMKKSRMQFQVRKKMHLNAVIPGFDIRKLLKIERGAFVYFVSQNIISIEDEMPISYNEYYINPQFFSLDAETVI